MRRNLFSFILLILTAANIHTNAQSLPVEAYASLPEINLVRLSPNGQMLAALINLTDGVKHKTAISILDLKTGQEQIALATDNKKFIVNSVNWANNNMLLIAVTYPASLQGSKISESRLLKYDIKLDNISSVIPKSFLKRLNYPPQFQTNIIDILPDDKNYILMAIAGHRQAQEPSIVRVSLAKGRTTYVQHSKKHIQDWVIDQQHQVRIGIYRNKTDYIIYELQFDTGNLRELWKFSSFSKEQVWPIGFGINPDELFVRALLDDDMAIFKVNLKSADLKKILIADNNSTIENSLLYSIHQDRFTGWDKEYASIIKLLNTSLPDKKNRIIDFSRDKQRYIVHSSNSTNPGIYLLGDRTDNSLTMISQQYPMLNPDNLRKKQAISYHARDGLVINGLLTLPPNSENKKLATIIFPHGGPISFDGDGFDYWTQFFASRNYAVLQMNFRGSSGYGHDFMTKGLKGWGLAMQDDVEDATKWLIKEGIADPDNICIVGASYGGYAALMATLKTPDLYKCAISFAGVSDLEYMVNSHRHYNSYEIIKKQVGEDRQKLKQTSPVNFAKQIKTPILLIHGTKDRVVKIVHSQKMYEALKDEGKDVTYIELNDGDHHLNKNDNRIQTFHAMEEFLEQHLSQTANLIDKINN